MKRKIAMVLLAGAMGLSLAGNVRSAMAEPTPGPKWTYYGFPKNYRYGYAVTIRTACLGAEDSAAHLKLLVYGGGADGQHIVYGCTHKGY